MNALWIAAILTPSLTPVAEWARVNAAFDAVKAITSNVAPISATDSPNLKAGKKRLFELCVFHERCRTHVAQHGLNATVLFNMVQVARDTAQAYADVANTPTAELAAQQWGLELSEALFAVYRRNWPQCDAEISPSNMPQPRAQVELFRGNVERALARYLGSLRPDWEGHVEIVFKTVARPLPARTVVPGPELFAPISYIRPYSPRKAIVENVSQQAKSVHGGLDSSRYHSIT